MWRELAYLVRADVGVPTQDPATRET
jgi:hypothetical protein